MPLRLHKGHEITNGRESAMKRWKFRIACCLVLLCIQSIAWAGMSALAEESLGETRHVDEVLESEYVTLILSADVQIPDGALSFPIYTSDYPPVDLSLIHI